MIIDAHEDIAWNVLTFGRDYMQGVAAIRERERGTPIPSQSGTALLGYDAWVSGEIAVIFATLFVSPARRSLGAWEVLVYSTQEEAHRIALQQVELYERLADEHPFRLIRSQNDLNDVLETWKSPGADKTHGLVMLMEGADAIRQPEEVADWYERGLRMVGLSWESTRYAGGTHEPGPLTPDGGCLLGRMQELGMILDLSHLAGEAYFQAVDRYEGVMIASHANPRKFLPTARGLSDEMIRVLVERDGVIGAVPYNVFLNATWKRGDPKELVSLEIVADAIDHICQIAGNANHAAIGTDFDGGFGLEHVPAEVNSVADMQLLKGLLAGRGYSPAEVDAVMFGNWLRILRRGLPA